MIASCEFYQSERRHRAFRVRFSFPVLCTASAIDVAVYGRPFQIGYLGSGPESIREKTAPWGMLAPVLPCGHCSRVMSRPG